MKKSQLIQLIKESLDEATNPLGLSKGDKITISSKVSNRPLGGYATFWEYTNGRVGYKVFGSSKVNYIDPQYVERRNYVADKGLDESYNPFLMNEKQKSVLKRYAEATGIAFENLLNMVAEARAKK